MSSIQDDDEAAVPIRVVSDPPTSTSKTASLPRNARSNTGLAPSTERSAAREPPTHTATANSSVGCGGCGGSRVLLPSITLARAPDGSLNTNKAVRVRIESLNNTLDRCRSQLADTSMKGEGREELENERDRCVRELEKRKADLAGMSGGSRNSGLGTFFSSLCTHSSAEGQSDQNGE